MTLFTAFITSKDSTMQSRLLTIVPYILFAMASAVWSIDRVVSIKQGKLRGLISSIGNYTMFMGIPFALVDPDNPFGNALPGPEFEGIFEANNDETRCPQVEEFNNTVTGSLDCLHLNIYVPMSASVSNRLPVMVYIFGGKFSLGFAGRYVYGPQYLVRHDVILVTLNYRIGPYGFMCLDIPSVPGNTGLKDQRLGLRWIKDNISAFGGDTSRITVFGNSAGAGCTELHILSTGSNGLFHQAILQSGTALSQEALGLSRPKAPVELAKYLGFSVETVEEALEIIKIVPTNEIILAVNTLGIKFKPCIEKVFDGVESFMTEIPDSTLSSRKYESVPLIIGYNSDENLIHWRIFKQENYFEQHQNVFTNRLNDSYKLNSEQFKRAAKLVQQFYIGTKPIDKEIRYDYMNFEADLNFYSPLERCIKFHLLKSDLPIYQYFFGYTGELNFLKRKRNITFGGASHADEIGFLFKQVYTPNENNPKDQLTIDRITTMWTNFAKYGDPTPEVSELLPVRWPLVSDAREYLWIDSDLKVDRKPLHSRIAFWDLFIEAFGKYQRWYS